MRSKLCILILLAVFQFGAISTPITNEKAKKFTVVIDAGHGGKDPGTEPSNPKKYWYEKDIALNVSRLVGKYLSERVENTTVIYTRQKDVYLTLDQRVNIAHETKADLFVSLHCNSNPDPEISGTQVHIHSKDFVNSLKLAKILQGEFAKRARRDEKMLQTHNDRGYNLFVLQFTKMPSVLIEMGFLSNPEEEKYLNTAYGQDIMASAIFRSIRTYKQKYFDKKLSQ